MNITMNLMARRLMNIVCAVTLLSIPTYAYGADGTENCVGENSELCVLGNLDVLLSDTETDMDKPEITVSMKNKSTAVVRGNFGSADRKVVMTVLIPNDTPYKLSDLTSENAKSIIHAVKQGKTGADGGFEFTFGIDDSQPGGNYQIKISCEGTDFDEESRTSELYFAGYDERVLAVKGVNDADADGMENALRHKALNINCDEKLYQKNKSEVNALMTYIRAEEGGFGGDDVEAVGNAYNTALLIAALSDDEFNADGLKTLGDKLGISFDTESDALSEEVLKNMKRNKTAQVKNKESLLKLYEESLALAEVNAADRDSITEIFAKYAETLEIEDTDYYKKYTDSEEKMSEWNANLAHQNFKNIEELRTRFSEVAAEMSRNNGGSGSSGSGSGGSGSGGSGGSGSGGSGSGSKGAGGFAASMTDGDVTTTDVKMPEKFSDLGEYEWAKDAILYLENRGVLSGKGEGIFEPGSLVTRAEFVKMLTLAFDLYDENAECEFSDCNKTDWFYRYVASAKAAGVVNGVSDEIFDTDGKVTREQAAAMLYRIIGGNISGQSEEFPDEDSVSDYAKEAVGILKGSKIILGTENGNFEPQANCTRAEAAVIIYRCLMKINV
ncbi:MAG: S-layer homology domain-containing protein [Monoglobaceae bacterium]